MASFTLGADLTPNEKKVLQAYGKNGSYKQEASKLIVDAGRKASKVVGLFHEKFVDVEVPIDKESHIVEDSYHQIYTQEVPQMPIDGSINSISFAVKHGIDDSILFSYIHSRQDHKPIWYASIVHIDNSDYSSRFEGQKVALKDHMYNRLGRASIWNRTDNYHNISHYSIKPNPITFNYTETPLPDLSFSHFLPDLYLAIETAMPELLEYNEAYLVEMINAIPNERIPYAMQNPYLLEEVN